eukprot:Clim_evm6s78 gene=Clim_evmTU6s78
MNYRMLDGISAQKMIEQEEYETNLGRPTRKSIDSDTSQNHLEEETVHANIMRSSKLLQYVLLLSIVVNTIAAPFRTAGEHTNILPLPTGPVGSESDQVGSSSSKTGSSSKSKTSTTTKHPEPDPHQPGEDKVVCIVTENKAEHIRSLECDDGRTYDIHRDERYPPGSLDFWLCVMISLFLVLFAGLMSGLTMGLLSLDISILRVYQNGSDEKARAYAGRIIPVVEKHHLLLVTLLLVNSACMEALPIFLDRIVHPVVAVILSVTLILMFGEIIPQAICTRFGLAVGANLAWLVELLMWVMMPIAWPISKTLDCVLGEDHGTFFRRAELREFVHLHSIGNEANEDPLTADEATVIKSALDMRNKTVGDVLTPMDAVFMLNTEELLDESVMDSIISKGYSRIPVYRKERNNIIGIILVKNLIKLNPADETRVKDLRIGMMHDVDENFSLYDMLNEFQKGDQGHMALVHRIDATTGTREYIGVVTLEDIIEELIGEEIIDETDVFVDVARRIRAVRKTVHNQNGELFRADSERFRTDNRSNPMRASGEGLATRSTRSSLQRRPHLPRFESTDPSPLLGPLPRRSDGAHSARSTPGISPGTGHSESSPLLRTPK